MNRDSEKGRKSQSGDSLGFTEKGLVVGKKQVNGKNGNKKWRGCFFVGILKCVQAGIGERYEILHAVSAYNGGQLIEHKILPEKKEEDQPQFGDGDFVVGIYPKKKKNPPRLILNQSPIAAVQVLNWTSIEQSKDGVCAVEYFAERKSGVVKARFASILGNEMFPGNIIICDHDVYLKGFAHIGAGEIRYSNVSRYVKDIQELRRDNQWIEVDFEKNSIGLLIPPPRPKNPWPYYQEDRKHPIFDCDGWSALREENMERHTKEVEPGKRALGSALTEEERGVMAAIDQAAEEHGMVLPSGKKDFVTFPVAQGISEQKKREKELKLAVMRENADKDNKARLDAVRERTMAIIGERERFVSQKSDPVELSSGVAPAVEEQHKDIEELDFLKSFKNYVLQECGFSYEVRDLIRFHASMKCSQLVVLGGAPGCGKSSLAKLYFRFLASRMVDSESLFIAVNPAWVEPADILGIENLNGKFIDAKCGLAKFVRKAMSNASGLFPVCLEEMNLACAEHYFSDFLQVVSQDDGVVAEIPGYETAGLPENAAEAPLSVPRNLRFVGTCNFDVTTHPFSPRFYDRCAYLELSASVPQFARAMPSLRDTPVCAEKISAEDFLHGWNFRHDEADGAVEKLFNELCPYLVEADIAPSPRVLAKIRKYVLSRPPVDEKLDEVGCHEAQEAALDEALAQYVLPKYLPATSAKLRKEQESLTNYLNDAKAFPLCLALLNSIDKRFGGYSLS